MCTGKWVLTLLILFSSWKRSVAKSCHYNNKMATFTWIAVKSPGYPGRFPAQTQCWWKITAPPQYRVQLEFTDFSLVQPNNKNQCVWQWLNVIEGASDPEGSSSPMLTMCGTNRPKLIISSGNSLRLNLHSNAAAASAAYRGFAARYKYTNDVAFMPNGFNLLLPDHATSGSSNGAGNGASSNGGVSRTLGDVIDPISRPKPLPPNPNAVLTLKNRRTESQNRLRNSGVDVNNAMNNNMAIRPRPVPQHYGPQVPVRPIPTRNTQDRQDQEEPPPVRSKPLRQEIKILLAVMGTIGGLALIMILVKKIACDKAHKRKPGGGRMMHAYAHFRRFNKKRRTNKKDESTKVNTISASIASANGTLRSRDSGVSTSHCTSLEKREETSQPSTMERNLAENSTKYDRKKIPGNREIIDPNAMVVICNQMMVENGEKRQPKMNTGEREEVRNSRHMEPHSKSTERRRRMRMRREKELLEEEKMRYETELRNEDKDSRRRSRRHHGRRHRSRHTSNHRNRQRSESSNYSDEDDPRGRRSWRERAYS